MVTTAMAATAATVTASSFQWPCCQACICCAASAAVIGWSPSGSTHCSGSLWAYRYGLVATAGRDQRTGVRVAAQERVGRRVVPAGAQPHQAFDLDLAEETNLRVAPAGRPRASLPTPGGTRRCRANRRRARWSPHR